MQRSVYRLEAASPADAGTGAGSDPTADSLRSAVDRGLAFYWTLTSVASEVAGGVRARLDVGSPDGGDRPESAGESPRGKPARGGERREQRPPWPGPLPRGPRVSLSVDAAGPGRADGGSDLDAFVRRADRLVLQENAHRALRYLRAEARASESRAAHDLKVLLQPLVLHVDQLRRARATSDEDLEFLDDLTRSLVEWVEGSLQDGALVEEVRLPSASRTEAADLRAALEEVLGREEERELTTTVPGRLPEVNIDRPLLEAGLGELLRLGRDVPRRLEVAPAGSGRIEICVEFGSEPGDPGSSGATADEPEYPPVTGGLLNLATWMDGALRLEAGAPRDPGSEAGADREEGADSAGRIEVRLPAADRSAGGGGSD